MSELFQTCAVHRFRLADRGAAGIVHEVVRLVELTANLDVGVCYILLHAFVQKLLPRPLLAFRVATEQHVKERRAVVLAADEGKRLVVLAAKVVAEAHELVHRAVGHRVEDAERLHLARHARRRKEAALQGCDVLALALLHFVHEDVALEVLLPRERLRQLVQRLAGTLRRVGFLGGVMNAGARLLLISPTQKAALIRTAFVILLSVAIRGFVVVVVVVNSFYIVQAKD